MQSCSAATCRWTCSPRTSTITSHERRPPDRPKASVFEDGGRADPLEGKIDRPLARRTRPVQGASGHSDELAGPDDQLTILELDDQLAIDAVEGLVGIGVPVPAKLLGHHAHSHLMIVHFAEGHIAIRFGLTKLERVNEVGRWVGI